METVGAGVKEGGDPTRAGIAKCRHCQERREVGRRAGRQQESFISTSSSSSPPPAPPIGQTQPARGEGALTVVHGNWLPRQKAGWKKVESRNTLV